MNVYDFDNTIFYPNSAVLFCLYCARRFPKKVLKHSLQIVWYSLLYLLHKSSLKKTEEQIFKFITEIPDVTAVSEAFWDKYQNKISEWYLLQKRDDDLIISASPEFLLKPIADRLGVRLVATKMDTKTGIIETNSCFAKEKTMQFIKNNYFTKDSKNTIENFYSDSISDIPMALCAEHAFLVKKHAKKIEEWPEFSRPLVKKFKRKYSKKI